MAENPFCSTCGNFHHFTQCTSKHQKCINCHEHNQIVKKSAKSPNDPVLQQLVDDSHSSASSNCPCYLYQLARLQGKSAK
jgi:hypothetical protein